MTGLSRSAVRPLDADAHLAQSITDILSTPTGSRVLRRAYGSELPRLIDRPINGATLVDVYAETAAALDAWEPRFRLRRVEVSAAAAGKLGLVLHGEVDHRAVILDAEVSA
ncbi:phage baseplate protein [Cereibacter changlensis]|uniref:Phage baseplate protein n=1 Tax=Cereibacter changlensis TaxID=402884 RepID=A0A4U0YYL0_9RHOB|nr:GPW/gp25 family protein [Cereibacter changlensis]TKA96908.1 phage baseplate protein [Cereibacter changlensis]